MDIDLHIPVGLLWMLATLAGVLIIWFLWRFLPALYVFFRLCRGR
jgi:hypothetical protein